MLLPRFSRPGCCFCIFDRRRNKPPALAIEVEKLSTERLDRVSPYQEKVQQSAEKEGVPPDQFVAGVTEQFIALWDKLDVRYDAWAATTDPLHKKCVQGMLQRLFDEGKIYKDKQVGFYSVRQEQFLTDKDRNYVNYVSLYALTTYISFIGYDPSRSTINEQPSIFRDKWPALHVIGKDIMIPAHGIYWPIMLHALGFPDEQMPTLLVHGWWNISGAKMSKSLGNVVDPDALIGKYGSEALRYYLMSDIVTGKDADFSEQRLIERYNSVLANNVGNLLNRTLNMAHRYRVGKISGRGPGTIPHISAYCTEMEQSALHAAFERVNDFVVSCNQNIEVKQPWTLAKNDSGAEELDSVLYQLTESLRIIAILISPILPRAAHGIFDQLNWKMELSGKEERFRLEDVKWGGLPDGHVVGKPVPVFPRIER